MRFIRGTFCLIILVAGNIFGQQFYRSEGLKLFNRAQYHTAIDSMRSWANQHESERGIAYYFIGESFYNLGLDETINNRAITYFDSSSQYFSLASKQTDMVSLYAAYNNTAIYKEAWAYFRLGELSNNPLSYLSRAYTTFNSLASSASADTISIYAKYMAGESRFRSIIWNNLQMLVTDNAAHAVELSEGINKALIDSRNCFQRVANSRNISSQLKFCAQIQVQNILFERGRSYQTMSSETFNDIDISGKGNSANLTSINNFREVNYLPILQQMDRNTKTIFESVIYYLEAVKHLNLFWQTGDDQDKQTLNSSLEKINTSNFSVEKQFLLANRDQRSNIKEDDFLHLADDRASLYARIARSIPEAKYWLGWVQFVSNHSQSEVNFQQFLDNTNNITNNMRISILREDALYRIFLLRFDKNAADRSNLLQLRQQIEAFNPQYGFVKEKTELLLKLIRIGLGERIWGNIISGASTADRMRVAFRLIRSMLVRATRVTGRERVPYLAYLDKLFEITQDRHPQATQFFRAFSIFLRAEIQDTAERKRRLYSTAANTLKSSTGDYKNEGLYIQARSHFASAKHEEGTGRNEGYERAKPIFIGLINAVRSLRSVYYLGEIFRSQGNDRAARLCYNEVMRKTKGKPNGEFWYSNANAGMQEVNTSSRGDSTVLKDINI